MAKFKEVIEIKGDLRDIKKKLNQLNGKLNQVGKTGEKSAKKIGKGFLTLDRALKATLAGALLAAIIAFKGLITSASKLQTEMMNVRTLTKWNTEEFRLMTETVQELSRTMPASARELAAGLYQVVSATVPVNQQLKVLEASAKAATAGITTTTSALNLGAAVIKAYGMSWGEFEGIQDQAFKTVELGQTTYDELAVSLMRVTAGMAAMKIPTQELFGAFATLTGVTGGTAEVSTQLRGIMTGLIKPTVTLTALTKKLGFESVQQMIAQEGLVGLMKILREEVGEDVEALGKLFVSQEALTGLMALSGAQYDILIDKTNQITNATGAMNDAFNIQKQTLSNQIKIFKNQLTPALVSITTGFTNALTAVNEFLMKLSEDALETAIRQMKELGVDTLEWELRLAKINEVMAKFKAIGLDEKQIMEDINIETAKRIPLIEALSDNLTTIRELEKDSMLLVKEINTERRKGGEADGQLINNKRKALWDIYNTIDKAKKATKSLSEFDDKILISLQEQLILVRKSNIAIKHREVLESVVSDIKIEQNKKSEEEFERDRKRTAIRAQQARTMAEDVAKFEREIAESKQEALDLAQQREFAEQQIARHIVDSSIALFRAGISGQSLLKTLGDSAFQLLILIARQRIYNALLNISGMTTGIPATGIIGFLAGLFTGHQGGYVKKMHTGGLMPNETLSVLKQGEFIIRDSAVRNVGIGTLARINQTGRIPQDFSKLERQMVLMNKNLKKLDRQVNIISEIDGVSFVRETVEPASRRLNSRRW